MNKKVNFQKMNTKVITACMNLQSSLILSFPSPLVRVAYQKSTTYYFYIMLNSPKGCKK